MSVQTADLAAIEWGADGQPVSSHFGDVYFSRHNGLAETRHVFLDSNDLPRRFGQLSTNSLPPTFTIAETGFGTGLNFLATWSLWLKTAPKQARLHFISVEKHPLSRPDLARALALWPELAPLSEQLLTQYPCYLGRSVQRIVFGRVSLTLLIDDAAQGFEQLLPSIDRDFCQPGFRVHAWFLDGFAPSKNPEMWSDALFKTVADLSGPGTTAATFSAAGIVKRGLSSAGFDIAKVPGFGRKREMLRATYASKPAQFETTPLAEGAVSVLQQATHAHGAKQAMVIGAGLAGCHTARALAERGWRVEVIERNACAAGEGSGNPQGLLYAKLSHRAETLPLWNLTALGYAQRFYQEYWKNPVIGARTGLLQLAESDKKAAAFHRTVSALGEPELCRTVTSTEASELAGVAVQSPGLYFAGCGWIDPQALCRALLSHSNISLKSHTDIDQIQHNGEHWQALSDKQTVARAPVVILACAHTVKRFEQCSYLPLKPIRGQVTYLNATPATEALRTALCGRGYIAPSHNGQHCMGATFNLGATSLQLNDADHSENLQHLQALSPALHQELAPTDNTPLPGRAAFRCTTPDYLPLVGPVANGDHLLRDFAELGKNARQRIACDVDYWPGLYVNCGHGSRGLAYTPLAAEQLASVIGREPGALGRPLANALHPARFLLRDIIRGQT
ncbi:bifunctional tRNA (5-methylaminomethyl-2-thiouridine)(34)-methyltransferase MnmD/FAD-dependent 5-carboxymethylaminomethyl-2-thiouridine(34) oxidoreductase MnmC [Gilvimarinus sp. SDUM040013]|uniref:tRNA 5-methylaminomethyl-2-thiouridine biosynthesis bifunctional protein MnmC n=1 Tax=Gilvimarinus gilvus TaxID=3058038 RepID=A0ABU4RS75_9GAMM|nr:bifunctional tRNA (5-methylaminomethyl-2-thiouridine)(34)-methyltransferase MnmD/FAD-dependent 5-carboxymethylaminomethyl-2-thiouridine(34) oxidoreductase MnmC [Gilvimarinus sp. SDUM040013]MDO3388188.1 bifunctional tRNA (5-methylaminomethyl-2-thiouridine)(34)-methyltransferase MnmD/FAD-dependent 5-carboxymethylaminomethyl-2-thiouridine(34) oxidoreductase MnmC [Gilvimarinus sp. SDUM040013]MDX6847738.1 bifunctional tRNA (5-methylaminomethyl-2-thiouridine)(34)-methyltransferase MnmD/FAD-dependent